MKNYKYLLLVSTCWLFNNNSLATELDLTFNSTTSSFGIQTPDTHTPVELKPISHLNGVKLAAVCALANGGCDGLGFGKSDNDINLDTNAQCRDESFVTSCGYGYVPDANNKCPYNNSFFKCRVCSHTCNSGALTTCNSDQVQTGTIKNDCNETCYSCRAKTCEEGGYASSITSCQKASNVTFAGKTCYSGVSSKTCTDEGYVASIPTNQVGQSTNFCGNTCYYNVRTPACSEGGYLANIPANQVCTSTYYYGRTCYKDCKTPSCKQQLLETGNYLDDGNGIIYHKSSPTTAYVLENTEITPITNAKTGNSYNSIYGVSYLKFAAPLCGNEPTPTITLRRAQSPYVASRSFNFVKIKFRGDSSATGNATFDINARSAFYNVQFVGSGSKNVTFTISGNSETKLDVSESFVNTDGILFNAIVKPAANYGGLVFFSEQGTPKWNNIRVQDGGWGRSFYNAEINQLTVNGGGSKWEVQGNTKIQTLKVENWAKFLSEANDGKLNVQNASVSGYAQIKFNYSKSNVIANLNMSNYGIVKVNYHSSLTIKDSLYMGGCSRMCSYTDPSNSYNGAISLQGATRTCACGGNNPSLLWSHDLWFGSSQFGKGCSQKYDANQWTCKNGGTRGKEGCGATYGGDGFWTNCW